jgi:hypothetical protein
VILPTETVFEMKKVCNNRGLAVVQAVHDRCGGHAENMACLSSYAKPPDSGRSERLNAQHCDSSSALSACWNLDGETACGCDAASTKGRRGACGGDERSDGGGGGVDGSAKVGRRWVLFLLVRVGTGRP